MRIYLITCWQCAQRLKKTAWHHLFYLWVTTRPASAARMVGLLHKIPIVSSAYAASGQHQRLQILHKQTISSSAGKGAEWNSLQHLHAFMDRLGSNWAFSRSKFIKTYLKVGWSFVASLIWSSSLFYKPFTKRWGIKKCRLESTFKSLGL